MVFSSVTSIAIIDSSRLLEFCTTYWCMFSIFILIKKIMLLRILLKITRVFSDNFDVKLMDPSVIVCFYLSEKTVKLLIIIPNMKT